MHNTLILGSVIDSLNVKDNRVTRDYLEKLDQWACFGEFIFTIFIRWKKVTHFGWDHFIESILMCVFIEKVSQVQA